uniref:Ig-like domain-containing protein n=1 Tax=Bos mutus grunniens TaxID=30521 RepID=A0A8B9XKP1_BOSMU
MLLLPLLLSLLWVGEWGWGSTNPHFPGVPGSGSEIPLDVLRSVSVQEGLCVHVACSVYYPWEGWKDSDPAHSYWFRERTDSPGDPAVATNNPEREVLSETQGRFLLVGDPWTKDCSLDIRDAQRTDTGTYIFRVERGPTSWVRVSASPALTDTPDIHVQGTLASGRPTNLTCAVPWACERGTPPTFSWTGVALTSPNPESPHSSVLTLTPSPQDHGTNLTCRVTFPGAGVSTEATIRLNVSCEDRQSEASFLSVLPGPETLGKSQSLSVLGPCLRLSSSDRHT